MKARESVLNLLSSALTSIKYHTKQLLLPRADRHKVSLIIPVFNMGRFLHDCLESLSSQTFKDIQIIFVDDCSTDNSVEIINEFKKKDSRIELYCLNKNTGPAQARNIGLQKAIGEYVQFVDPDDLLPSTAVERLYSAAAPRKADMARGNGVVFQDGKKEKVIPMRNIKWVKSAVGLSYQNDNFHGLPWYHPIFLFRRRFLLNNRLRYPDLRSGEDPIFLLKALLMAKETVTVSDTVYMYRAYKKGYDRFKTSSEYKDHFFHFREMKKIWLKKGMKTEWQTYFDTTFWWFWINFVTKNKGAMLENYDSAKTLFVDLPSDYQYPLENAEKACVTAVAELKRSEFETLYPVTGV